MGFVLHFHILAAIAWIGGSIFMAVIGIFIRDKNDQRAIYPKIGPIFGYYQIVSLVILLVSGYLLALKYGLLQAIWTLDGGELVVALQKKLLIIVCVIILTILHFYIAIKTVTKDRTKKQHIISRGSSLLILLLNLWILHYAIVLRSGL
ncbi:MAG TPA: hypothetical protein ENN12_02155 [Epsilonproteobacteria bacterium]|nr:hypothetical protein [Campylobacterota bacterium]